MKIFVALTILISSVFANAMIEPIKDFDPNEYPPSSLEIICQIPWTRPFADIDVSYRLKIMEACVPEGESIIGPDDTQK